jgi:hypothetical protein
MKKKYCYPAIQLYCIDVESGFTASGMMDSDSPVKDLEWD